MTKENDMGEEMSKFEMRLRNLLMLPQRIMMRYLRSRGWVVFWLDEQARFCKSSNDCWLKLYQNEMLRKSND
jgi:hypothetical protein